MEGTIRGILVDESVHQSPTNQGSLHGNGTDGQPGSNVGNRGSFESDTLLVISEAKRKRVALDLGSAYVGPMRSDASSSRMGLPTSTVMGQSTESSNKEATSMTMEEAHHISKEQARTYGSKNEAGAGSGVQTRRGL